MNIYETIRKLAKSTKYQNLFVAAKDLSTLRLFINDIDLSRLQDMFLAYLYLYDHLFADIAMKEVSKKVLENTVYEDAYFYWKREKKSDTSKKDSSNANIKLIKGNNIKFPKR
jgi:hypothetical protein